MLNSLKIQNFKAIENLEIPELGQINLITGKNNTSKTSLLEAVSILVSGFDLEWVNKILEYREEYIKILLYKGVREVSDYHNSFLNLFTNRIANFDIDSSVFIGNDKDNIRFKFAYFKTREYINENGQKAVAHYISNELSRASFAIIKNERQIILPIEEPRDFHSRSLGLPIDSKNFQYIHPFVSDNNSNAKLWDKLSLTDSAEQIIKALQIIDERIEKIAFIGESDSKYGRQPVVKIKNQHDRILLKSMGDGINRILTIALSMVNAENGYLFIDEFENGLHYSVQVQLWEVIFYLAKELNVQVFATTHSSDTVSAFSMITSENENIDLGKVIKLQRKNEELKAIVFSHEDLKIANEQDLNLR